MPISAQICMIVVTIALLAVAVMAIRMMLRTNALIEAATRSLAELPTFMAEARMTSARVDELLIAFTQISRSARVGVAQFEDLATRSSALASGLLDEVERPVSQAVAVIRGLRFGARHLFQRWSERSRPRPASRARAVDPDDEARWLDDGGGPARA